MTEAHETLERLLAAERQALASGDIGAVADLLADKQAALARLQKEGIPPQSLIHLRGEAQNVQVLLAACLEGITAARAHLTELRRVSSGLTTYDSHGRKTDVTTEPTHGLERKA